MHLPRALGLNSPSVNYLTPHTRREGRAHAVFAIARSTMRS